jgi:type II secretory pathway pseudopilin PulG
MGRQSHQAGATFISVIFVVMLIGIMLAMTGQSWSRLMKREKEEELMFRGKQIFTAISTWNRSKAGHPPTPLRELKDLCKDPRSLQNVRYLRCDPGKKDPLSYMLQDPITGKEFEVIKGGPTGGIIGVKSTSDVEPIKQANFPDELKHFEGKKKYSEWQFVQSRYIPQLVKSMEANPAGRLDLKSPFLPDEKDKPKAKSP